MPANVEEFQKRAMFASLRVPAWHGLGTVLDKPLPIRKFAAKANLLNWDVRKVDAKTLMPDANFAVPIFLNVRTNPITGQTDVLGSVGKIYENFQVEDMLDTAEAFNKRFRAETMGSVGMATVFMSFVHPDDIVLDPKGGADTIKRYFLLYKAFNGTAGFVGRKANTRVVCQNTLNVAIGEYPAEFKVRHTKTMRDRVMAAAAMSEFADTYDAAFEAEAQALYAKAVNDAKFEKIVAAVYPKPDDGKGKGSETRHSNQIDRVWNIWRGGTGSMDNVPRNAWRAWNALTEENQWFRQIRQDNTDNAYAAGAGFDRNVTEFRESTLGVVRELALAK